MVYPRVNCHINLVPVLQKEDFRIVWQKVWHKNISANFSVSDNTHGSSTVSHHWMRWNKGHNSRDVELWRNEQNDRLNTVVSDLVLSSCRETLWFYDNNWYDVWMLTFSFENFWKLAKTLTYLFHWVSLADVARDSTTRWHQHLILGHAWIKHYSTNRIT